MASSENYAFCFSLSRQGRHCFCTHKNPNKDNFALANKVMCYANFMYEFSNCHVKVMLCGERR